MNFYKILSLSHLASSLLIVFCVLATSTKSVWAEGSKDLYPNGALGNRGNILWTGGTAAGFRDRTLLRVFAESGQLILTGSSAVGIGAGDIEIYNPGQVMGSAGNENIPTTANADFVCSSQRSGQASGTGNGFIGNRTQELAGAQSVDGIGNLTGYIPCSYQAPTTGIYYVAIYGPSGKNGTTNASAGANGSINNFNIGTNQATGISAWDVTVRDSDSSTTDLEGRLHSYFITMNLGGNGRDLHSALYPITEDGYRYRIDFNGLDPFGFRIFGNMLGNLDSDGISPLYRDVLGTNGNIANPVGGTSSAPPQFPIFFNELNTAVLSFLQAYDPLTGAEAGTGFAAVPATPIVSNITYGGSVSGTQSTVNSGGTFSFDSNIPGVYEIVISRDGVDFDPSAQSNRVLRGLMTSSGTQTIPWNGLDNSASPFPVGQYDYIVRIHAGEYHFPMSDAENNFNGGPTYTLIEGTNPLGNNTAFYDHRGYVTVDGDVVADRNPGDGDPTDDALCGSNPPNPAFTDLLNGANSTGSNFNRFGGSSGGNTNTQCTGAFGDTKTLDLWTFRPNALVIQQLEIVELDYGDAPDTYGTDDTAGNSSNSSDPVGASHQITADLFLGTTAPDSETNGFVDGTDDNGNATDDDAAGTDDEDDFPLPILRSGDTSYTIPAVNITATNNTGTNATLHGWIDFNNSGTFEASEYASVVVNNVTSGGNPTGDLTWSGISVGSAGNTYARFRLTTDGSINATTPGGAASDGEVEDYQIAIANSLPCPTARADLWFANDESGSVNNSEFNNSLDFIYQVSDQFEYGETTGIKAGIFGWAANTPTAARNNIIIPITDTFGDPDDTGLISDNNIDVSDPDNLGIREQYTSKVVTSNGTRLDRATNYLADLIIAGAANGARANTPQVAIMLTDANSGQITNFGSGGGSRWTSAADRLKFDAGAKIVLIIIDDAANAYNNSDFNDLDSAANIIKSVVGADINDVAVNGTLVGDDGILLIVPTYTQAADATQGYVELAAQAVCDSTGPVATDPELLLTKRITAINPEQPNAVTFSGFVDDDSDADNNPKWPNSTNNGGTVANTYTVGTTNGGSVVPGDILEYTIYYLSSGEETASNVLACDLIPANTEFVTNDFDTVSPAPGGTSGLERGLVIEFNGNIQSLTNGQDGDRGYYFPPGVEPSNVFPNVRCSNSNTPNTNGAIVVNLGDVPHATASGTPVGSFGLIRFRVRVR
ncbi:MAG: GEVED domain-containing protein [Cyanobacteria bacterium J06621_8]